MPNTIGLLFPLDEGLEAVSHGPAKTTQPVTLPKARGPSSASGIPARCAMPAYARWAVVAGAALFCASWLGCSASNPRASTRGAGQPMPVSVATVQRHDLPVFLTGLGSVTAYNTVSVKSRVDGQLVEVAFKEGQEVHKGDLLAVIDPRPYEVQLNQAQAQLFRDQAQLRDAELNYQRYKGLLENSGAMSQQQVDTQQSTVDQLEGAVRTDQAAIDNAKLQLVYCRITAPVNGRVGLRLVDVGNMVHATDTNALLVITQLQPIAVIFTLPEGELPEVAKHMSRGTLKVEAYSQDDQTKLATGQLLTIDNQIDTSTGTGRLKAIFNNEDHQLWPNQFVNVHLLLDVQKNATLVPAAAVERGPQGDYVFVVKPDQTVEVRTVTTTITQNNTTEIASGLSPGEVVVTDGQDKLDSGSKVQTRSSVRPTGKPGQQAVPMVQQ
jgi:membrane fusion protein, multidrug efflux system